MLKAEYIAHMDSFRVYDDNKPEWTMAYADDLGEVKDIAKRLGEEIKVVICL